MQEEEFLLRLVSLVIITHNVTNNHRKTTNFVFLFQPYRAPNGEIDHHFGCSCGLAWSMITLLTSRVTVLMMFYQNGLCFSVLESAILNYFRLIHLLHLFPSQPQTVDTEADGWDLVGG